MIFISKSLTMSYSRRTYRHRNPKQAHHSKATDAFFTRAGQGAVQAKEETPFFQAKLTVGQPGDQYEQEADEMANRVTTQTQSGAGAAPVQRKKISHIQRLSSSKEEEKLGTNEEKMRRDKEIQAKPDIQQVNNPDEKQEEERVQMKTQEEEKEEIKDAGMAQRKPGADGGITSPVLSSRIERAEGKGQPLPGDTLVRMQSSFGHDFSDVHIHTGEDSAAMNKELGAQAFTHGKDIFFNKDKYSPESTEGKKLLAHELTHVVQQTSAGDKSS